jgi:cytochrome c553
MCKRSIFSITKYLLEMGSNNLFSVFVRVCGLITFSLCAIAAVGQNVDKQDTIPAKPVGIYQVLMPSCMPCHSNEGRDKPRNAVNFSIWEQYTPIQKMMLAGSIQNEVKKGSMPPKGFLTAHPASALNEAQLAQLVQWCDSMKSKP